MGAHFHLPIHDLSWEEINHLLKGVPVFLATAESGIPLWGRRILSSLASFWLAERPSAQPAWCEKLATEPGDHPDGPGGSESLNAAIAAGILIAEVPASTLLHKKGLICVFRSITTFAHPRWPVNRLALQKVGIFAQQAPGCIS